MFFKLLHTDHETKARAGLLTTVHGVIETPVFMPVGTLATVKTLTPREIESTGAKLILGNAYHLYLRPGHKLVEEAGGIHKFSNWNGSVLTDSGGYQVFSLNELRKVTDEGVHFKSHIDGSKHFFTPESVIDIERSLGPDIMMVFDECPPSNAERPLVEKAVERTIAWAKRAVDHLATTQPLHGYEQHLFLIVQGGVHQDLRIACAEQLVALDTPGYAIGGLAVGEPNEVMYQVTDWTTDVLPKEKPRYLMGVGTPLDIVESVYRGIDMFDCVLPTRNARNGQLFTNQGKLNITNSRYKRDFSLIDEETDSYASQNFTKAYLSHLFNTNEILGLRLATEHNIAFYQQLMRTIRLHILQGTFAEWRMKWIARYKAGIPV
ncbi:MAG TPA: tRNA guanosine(34) transglycosylase Tgt [Candidatus Kapabacteria bacterium]|nr:tRNA guanosine(34) transglycosylase Tgt [Candidatus Kapabacteria bacterium]